MLQELTIDNLAIINHLTLAFDDQMTVLTGETGAGKSIIIDAVGLLAGSRGSTDFIRRGADKLTLQGQFTVPENPQALARLDEYGIDHADGTLIISREIHQSGRNTIRVNGTLVNTTILKAIGAGLVDIQGQNEHQLLMQPENHLTMLDQFAGAPVKPLLSAYQTAYAEYQQLKAAVERKKKMNSNGRNGWICCGTKLKKLKRRPSNPMKKPVWKRSGTGWCISSRLTMPWRWSRPA